MAGEARKALPALDVGTPLVGLERARRDTVGSSARERNKCASLAVRAARYGRRDRC
ncbi:hypothetical protein BD626DRAFT_515183 [Schizophyllum amplum]|uniref:Uncharacterized protein n=1 Tax=Schizophyllum amplum TaxID=97359 RepID=A0A550BXY5_9AGAR|nr:hypothetical protein BD626DRAFT_515183 [Auriculariopsis ampla]